MSEQLADNQNQPTAPLIRLYERWANSGAGLLITGKIMIDRAALSEPRQVVINTPRPSAPLQQWAKAATSGGAQAWVQLNHAGRQTPRSLNPEPLAPSAVPVRGPRGLFGTPRAMTESDIGRVIGQFGQAASSTVAAGFTGVQIHAAHGYLISQFLSPATNHRTDAWGGDAARRRRLLGEIVGVIRDAIGPEVPIGVKLNSTDFQRHGTEMSEAVDTVDWLAGLGVDLLEVSGGTFEEPTMIGTRPNAGRQSQREAYFWDFAEKIRSQTSTPLMLTGGFRTETAMRAAVQSGTVDVIGLARPLTRDPELPAALLQNSFSPSAPATTRTPRWCSGSSMIAGLAEIAWHTEQIRRAAHGRPPKPTARYGPAMIRYAARQLLHTARMRIDAAQSVKPGARPGTERNS